jgi:hypothetical protein
LKLPLWLKVGFDPFGLLSQGENAFNVGRTLGQAHAKKVSATKPTSPSTMQARNRSASVGSIIVIGLLVFLAIKAVKHRV